MRKMEAELASLRSENARLKEVLAAQTEREMRCRYR